MPPSAATSQYPPVTGSAAMPTTGASRCFPPIDPKKPAPPKAKTPPSDATKRYPGSVSAVTNVWLMFDPSDWSLAPTAVHTVGPTHDTESSVVCVADVLGLDARDQLLPFQVSTSVSKSMLSVEDEPTAVHAEGPVHDTPVRAFWTGAALGLTTMDQLLPSHISTSVCGAELAVMLEPTAIHAVGLLHDT